MKEKRRGIEAAFYFRSIHAVLINEYDPTARHSSTSFCWMNFINRPCPISEIGSENRPPGISVVNLATASSPLPPPFTCRPNLTLSTINDSRSSSSSLGCPASRRITENYRNGGQLGKIFKSTSLLAWYLDAILYIYIYIRKRSNFISIYIPMRIL